MQSNGAPAQAIKENYRNPYYGYFSQGDLRFLNTSSALTSLNAKKVQVRKLKI